MTPAPLRFLLILFKRLLRHSLQQGSNKSRGAKERIGLRCTILNSCSIIILTKWKSRVIVSGNALTYLILILKISLTMGFPFVEQVQLLGFETRGGKCQNRINRVTEPEYQLKEVLR